MLYYGAAMEPQIQYAQTEDGVSIAFWALGTGPPLLFLPPMPGHIRLEWESEVFGDQFRALSGRYRIIRFDGRNSGLSERSAVRRADSDVLDIDAVLESLALDQAAILAFGAAGLVAMRYAAQRPSRVSALVLSECFAAYSDLAESTQLNALIGLAGQDYEMFTETMGNLVFGWEASKAARQFAAILRASMTQEELTASMSDVMASDISDQLPAIKTKTLVLHHQDARLVPMAAVQRLAEGIPNARLVILEGDTLAGVEIAAMDDFIIGETARPYGVPPGQRADTAVILFLDIADSTALTTKLGDAAYREKERALDESLRAAITEAGGTPVEGKVLGDGVMAVFTSARQAIEAAQRCRDLGNQAGLPLHLGIHAGDVVREGNNVHGGAVQLAARVQSVAAPGEILVSATVRDLARTSAGVAFEDRGEHELKGIAEPQRLFAVREQG